MNQPSLVCTERSFDFGRLANTNQVTRVFELVNNGGTPLVIQRIQAVCGCTVAKAEPLTVPPGEKSRLTIGFNLAGRTGPQRKAVYLHSNDPARPIVQFLISGDAVAVARGREPVPAGTVRIEPQKVDFGHVALGDVAADEIVVSGGSTSQPLRMLDVRTGMSNLLAKVQSVEGAKWQIGLRLLPPHAVGPGSTVLRIRTNQPAMPDMNVPVAWVGWGDLHAVPEELVFVLAEGHTNAACRYIAIRSRSGQPFRIERVELPEPVMETKWEPLPTGGYAALKIERKDSEGARAFFEQAIALEPRHPNPYYGLATLLNDAGKPAESLATLDRMFDTAELDDARMADIRKESREFHLQLSAQVADADHDRLWKVTLACRDEVARITASPVEFVEDNSLEDTTASSVPA